MHARVNYRQIPPDRMDEAISIYRDSVLPRHIGAKGFKGGLVLTDRGAGKAIAISLWETEADLTAFAPGTHIDALAAGPPVREIHEVSAYDRPESEAGKTTHARVNTRQIQSGKMDEAIHTYQDSTVPLRRQQGSTGVLLFTNRGTGKAVAISLWASEGDMRAAEPSRQVDHISVGPPTREFYEFIAEV